MKKLLLVLLFVPLVSFAQTKVYEQINEFDESNNKVGYWKHFYDDGQIIFKNGSYEEIGQVESEGYYKSGLKDSLWITYLRSGGIMRERGYYRKGLKHGPWESFTYNDGKGVIENKGEYLNDKKTGLWTEYAHTDIDYGLGKNIIKETTYVNGERRGPFIEAIDSGPTEGYIIVGNIIGKNTYGNGAADGIRHSPHQWHGFDGKYIVYGRSRLNQTGGFDPSSDWYIIESLSYDNGYLLQRTVFNCWIDDYEEEIRYYPEIQLDYDTMRYWEFYNNNKPDTLKNKDDKEYMKYSSQLFKNYYEINKNIKKKKERFGTVLYWDINIEKENFMSQVRLDSDYRNSDLKLISNISVFETGSFEREARILKTLGGYVYTSFRKNGRFTNFWKYNINRELPGRVNTKGDYGVKGFGPFPSVSYYKSGNIRSVLEHVEFESKRKKGKHTYYWENGNIWSIRNYYGNIMVGKYVEYYENGQLKEESNWDKGKKSGIYKTYYENGQLKEESNWSNDKVLGIRKTYDQTN